MAWSSASTSRWQDVDPRLQEVLAITRDRTGIPFEISEGMRSEDRQRQMVDEGKSQTMNSKHLGGGAVDINIPDGSGGVNWDFEAYRPIADMAKTVAGELGYDDLVWGGDWDSLKDGVHFQMSGGDQVSVDQHISDFDQMLQGGGQQRQQSGGQQGGGQQTPLPDTSLSFTQKLAGALGNISDRANAYGQRRALPQQLRGDAMMEGMRQKKGRNKTAEYLNAQGHGDLANAIMNGQISGAQAMQMVYAQMSKKPADRFRSPTAQEIEAYKLDPTKPYRVNETTGKVESVGGGGVTVNTGDKPMTEGQTKFNLFHAITEQVRPTLNTMEDEGLNFWQAFTPAFAQSDEFRSYTAASSAWSEAYLRATSGATITDDDVKVNQRSMFPVPGDPPSVVQNKRELRAVVEKALQAGTGREPDVEAAKAATAEAEAAAAGGGGTPAAAGGGTPAAAGGAFIDPDDVEID